MAKRTHRFLFVMVALTGGILIVLLLTYLGTRSKGPLDNLLSHAGNAVSAMENKMILEQRSDTRKKKLEWFQPYHDHPDLFKQPETFLLGVYDNQSATSFDNIFKLEKSIGTTFPLIQIYTAWGSKPEQQFPEKMVRAIFSLGSVPVITWEPWLTDFDDEKYPGLRNIETRDKGGMADVASGLYDEYIRAWASEAAKMQQTLFIRFGHEMNDPYRYPWGPHNNQAKEFVAAWKHVHQIFTDAGADNVLWIWSPHPSYGWFEAFYPGDEYVDWIGTNILNYGTVAIWSKWWTFQEMFGPAYHELVKFGKPMMITEFGCLEVGGDRPVWLDQAFSSLIRDYPMVKSLLFFHFSADNTTTEQTLNWTILEDPRSLFVVGRSIRNWPDSLKPRNSR